ncbi:MAG: hypothetical protein GEU88_12875 [Solirubrobacterales bacterium]|nr:hypothetical protein [Solirubrobacterales bacterium]
MPGAFEDLVRDYRGYDRRVDIISAFEFFFARVPEMAATVRHFERFPRYEAADGREVAPDFTVLFVDDTMLVGELSSLARSDESLRDLTSQIGRYDALEYGPSASRAGGGHDLAKVEDIDVLLVMPSHVSNYACDRIAAAAADPADPYMPRRPPSILSWNLDPDDAYTFKYGNPRPRGHGRSPSLEEWLLKSADTLRGHARHFLTIKQARRFMNDRPVAAYTATILWLEALPQLAGGPPPIDIDTTPSDVTAWLRENLGAGDVNMVRSAFEFLQRAGLARPVAEGWRIGWRVVAASHHDLARELVRRHLSRPTGPPTLRDREQAEAERARGVEAEAASDQPELAFGTEP